MKIYSNNKAFDDIVEGMVDYLRENKIQCGVVQKILKNDEDLYIIFGLNNFTEHSYVPKNYIAMQLEQSGVPNTSWFTPLYFKLLNGAHQVWDYSMCNMNNLKRKINVPFCYVPLLYMKHLTRNDRLDVEKDIDVLFIGMMNEKRKKVINNLEKRGIKIYVAKNYDVWGENRHNVFKRSKILLNLHYYDNAILETARLSYALSLGECLVVSERSSDKLLDRDYSKFVEFSSNIDEIEEKITKILEMSNEMFKMRVNTTFTKYKLNAFKIKLDIISKYSDNAAIEASAKQNAQLFLKPNMDNEGKIPLPKLSYEDLPCVSIVTITKNRKDIFELPIRNFYEFEYPKDKLEWVIIDDGNDNLKSVLPVDKRIKYVRYTDIPTLAQKRDIGVQQSSYEIIAFMDDDDYYFPCSIYSRVALMMHYRRDCVGCTDIGVYDIVEDTSFINNGSFISEASMAFKRTFWKERQFGTKDHTYGEGYLFIDGREERVINMPYFFNLIAITHNSNITEGLRKIRPDKIDRLVNYVSGDTKNPKESVQKMDNFFNLWDTQTQLFFLSLIKKNAYLLQ